MSSPKDEKDLVFRTDVVPAEHHAVEVNRVEADIELAETHEGEFGTKRDLVSRLYTSERVPADISETPAGQHDRYCRDHRDWPFLGFWLGFSCEQHPLASRSR